jgi:hypothetical protein
LRRKDAFISRAFAAACLVALLCGHLCAAGESALPQEIKTEHYDLYVEGADGKEVGRLVEGLYAELKQFFHAEPEGRLRVKILADKQSFIEAIHADKVVAPPGWDSVGVFSPATRIAYASTDPADPYSTRAKIRHECTHQFHYSILTGKKDPQSRYYIEGLATHFGLHCWDGYAAKAGAIPDIASDDTPGTALRVFKNRHNGSLRALATDGGTPDYSGYCEAWGLVSFLISEEPEAWQKWATALDDGATPESAWAAAFGVDRSDEQLSEKYLRWLQSQQESWQAMCGAWQSSAAHQLEADARTNPRGWSIAVTRARFDVVKFSAKATSPEARLGIVAVQDADGSGFVDSTNLCVDGEGSVQVYSDPVHENNHEHELNHWKVVPNVRVRHPRNFDVELRRKSSGFEVFIDGGAVARLEGIRAGPEVIGGSATFSNVVTEMFPPGNAHPSVAAAAISGPPEKKSYAWLAWPGGTAGIAASVGLVLWSKRRRRLRSRSAFRPAQSIKAGERPNDANARLRVPLPRSRGLLAAVRRRTSDWRPTRLKEWAVGAAIVLFLGYFAYMPHRSSGEFDDHRDTGYSTPSSEVRLQTHIEHETAAVLFLVSVTFAALYLARHFSWAARTRRRYAASAARGVCPGCGYDLTANVSGTCPECGTRIGHALACPAPPSVHLSSRRATPHAKKSAERAQ